MEISTQANLEELIDEFKELLDKKLDCLYVEITPGEKLSDPFHALVVSELFSGLPQESRTKLVHEALGSDIVSRSSFNLTTWTQAEWDAGGAISRSLR